MIYCKKLSKQRVIHLNFVAVLEQFPFVSFLIQEAYFSLSCRLQ
jgi:hypothetical protein